MSSELQQLRERASQAEAKLLEIERLLQASKQTTDPSDSLNSDEKQSDASLTVESIIFRLSNPDYTFAPSLVRILGAKSKGSDWKGVECGDGNINYIFIIENEKDASKSLVIKQAPPYIRLVGPVWPLKQQRIDFEVKYTQFLAKFGRDPRDESRAGSRGESDAKSGEIDLDYFKKLFANKPAPEVYFYDSKRYLFAMENLRDCVIFRTQLGKKMNENVAANYPLLGSHIGYMLANSLFFSSDIALPNEERTQLLRTYTANAEMIAITEQVIFEEPYFDAPNNKRKLGSDPDATIKNAINGSIAALRVDEKVIEKVLQLRELFRCKHEALLHGDLHTGSLMVNSDRTVAIDAEFSFFGPMAFDIGQIIGNMALGLIAQQIYEKMYQEDRNEFKQYIARQIEYIWNVFKAKFLDLWACEEVCKGNLYPKGIISDEGLKSLKQRFMSRVFEQSLGFAASVMIRRCIGIADAPEYRVEDEKARENAEDKAIRFARQMMVKGFPTIEEMTQTLLKFE